MIHGLSTKVIIFVQEQRGMGRGKRSLVLAPLVLGAEVFVLEMVIA